MPRCLALLCMNGRAAASMPSMPPQARSMMAASERPSVSVHAVQLASCVAPPTPVSPLRAGNAGLIQASNGRLPPRLAPLRTGVVQVARGSEAALPGGRAACDFAAGLMSVATLLARQEGAQAERRSGCSQRTAKTGCQQQRGLTRTSTPAALPCAQVATPCLYRAFLLLQHSMYPDCNLLPLSCCPCRNPVMTVDVYHRQRLADDLLLGRAHVPLAPLLQVADAAAAGSAWRGHWATCLQQWHPSMHPGGLHTRPGWSFCAQHCLKQQGWPPRAPCRRAGWTGGPACLRWCRRPPTRRSTSGCRWAPCTWSCLWRRQGRRPHLPQQQRRQQCPQQQQSCPQLLLPRQPPQRSQWRRMRRPRTGRRRRAQHRILRRLQRQCRRGRRPALSSSQRGRSSGRHRQRRRRQQQARRCRRH